MTHIRITPFGSLLVAAFVSLSTAACAPLDLLSNRVNVAGAHYDAQDCVENALRHDPEPETVRAAAVAFTHACNEGEAAACSALGVMYELGRGFPASSERALALYGTACDAHNSRACANRDGLLRSDGTARLGATRIAATGTATSGGM